MIGVVHDSDWVGGFVLRYGNVVDTNAPLSVVLLERIHLELHVADQLVLRFDLLLEGLGLGDGVCEKLL